MKIMVAAHGHLADGVKSTLSLFMDADRIVCVNAYTDEEDYVKKITEFIDGVSEEEPAIIFTDMYGGSVNQKVISVNRNPHVRVVTGFNIPLILEVCLMDVWDEDELQNRIMEAREEMKLVRLEDLKEVADESDDDFLS